MGIMTDAISKLRSTLKSLLPERKTSAEIKREATPPSGKITEKENMFPYIQQMESSSSRWMATLRSLIPEITTCTGAHNQPLYINATKQVNGCQLILVHRCGKVDGVTIKSGEISYPTEIGPKLLALVNLNQDFMVDYAIVPDSGYTVHVAEGSVSVAKRT
ncbi:unnamed protein product [Meganyctiphanes norvegica]|uniref:Uncharacterized protein n=1 Tax=Meganyctiphanes norvegica TaxID=48144 RepID=A0AAV2Q7K9_MEGNR